MDRPGFRQLMKHIETGRVDTLVVWRLDRLGRTVRGLTALFEDLIRWKVNLMSLEDGRDLVTPAGSADGQHPGGSRGLRYRSPGRTHPRGPDGRRERGIPWGGSRRGRRIKVTVEQITAIRR